MISANVMKKEYEESLTKWEDDRAKILIDGLSNELDMVRERNLYNEHQPMIFTFAVDQFTKSTIEKFRSNVISYGYEVKQRDNGVLISWAKDHWES